MAKSRKNDRSQSSSSVLSDDPHSDREARKYDNPIPSREYILEQLKSHDKGMTPAQLQRVLHLRSDEEKEGLRRRLKAMLRDGQLLDGRRGRVVPSAGQQGSVEGVVQGHRDGYGFVLVDGDDGDVYLPSRQMHQVFDGDRVSVAVTGIDSRGRREGIVREVLEHNTQQLVGKLIRQGGRVQVEPDNSRIQQWIAIDEEVGESLNDGDYVMVAITQQPGPRQQARGRVVEVLGDRRTVGVATEIALRRHEIPHDWPEAVEDEARRFGSEPREQDKQHRVDLRQLPLVTIDGEDARDFDDAVYCEPKKGGGWRLWVAIADVSHYVGIGSALDEEAFRRGTSVYFPDRVVPMLPEALSNGLCSLKPDVDRLCMVCEMTISARGRLSGYIFYEGVLRSHARLTYNEVGALLELPDVDPAHDTGRHHHLLPQLKNLHALYKALRSERSERGAIDFETVETRVLYDDNKRIDAIVPVARHDAHKLIEECMLCANVATARALERSGLEALFRVHAGPSGQKLGNLRAFLGEIGLDLRGGDDPNPKDYQALLSSVSDRPDAQLIQTMMLRSLSQAVYQPNNEGHFGLNYGGYTHFTSPIRRYPDLLVHRALRFLVRSPESDKKVFRGAGDAPPLPRAQIYPYDMEAMLVMGEQCSMAERRADDASRDVMAFLKCEFLQEHVGDEFDGVIAAVTGFGLFVELSDLYIEGLVHISVLPQDYYHFDQAHQRLIGDRTRRKYQLGDELRVQVLNVDMDERKVDLGLVAMPTNRSKKPSVRQQLAEGVMPPTGKKAGGKPRPSRQSKSGKGKSAKKASGKSQSKRR
ncbi:ribonuclease R [Spongiibacter nanhainus]|uniref:Ribonuclease R n=1 Tax=Spongiibacter nanhainus TaxID=2794344 RepID=A0A7T4QZJ5_9GAMM|nr:ribonuclease R [Spongiibacter nanhainus]QQD17666.1 ribonuclease R [Spongiibacter nanhainus]